MTLELHSVEKSYAGFDLGPLDLAVENDVLAVLGPSGCGKTTLLSVIAGIVAPDSGAVRLGGRDLAGRPPEARGTALVFQEGALFPHMTARENVAYAAESEGRVAELSTELDIEDVLDRPARALSGGERQRVALARALAADPDALLLDEPLSGLDVPIRRRLADDLRERLAAASVPVVYVTHDRREASVVADRLAVLHAGRIEQVDPPKTVFERPATPFVARFTGATNVFRARIATDAADRTDGGEDCGLVWRGRRLDAPIRSHAGSETVEFCVRPERVVLAAANATTDGPDTVPRNTFHGRVVRRTFEGDAVRVAVALDTDERAQETEGTPGEGASDDRVEVSLGPRDAATVDPDGEDRVAVSFPPDAIHVMEE